MTPLSEVRFAVVGPGVIGDVHARALRRRARRSGDRRLSICTPTETHARLAVPALAPGMHVMHETPVDVSLAAADRIIAAETASGKKVGIVLQHRFDPATERVTAGIHNGDLGRLTSGVASSAWAAQSYYDGGRWRRTWAMHGGGPS